MGFDHERYAKRLHDAGGFFKDENHARQVAEECGGSLKGTEKRVFSRYGGVPMDTGKCAVIVTDVEAKEARIERGNRGQSNEGDPVTINGPHEYLDYVPIARPVVETRGKRKRGSDE